MHGLDDIAGQAAVKERLRQLAGYYLKSGTEFPHVLIVGASGMGQRTISLSLANELGVPIKLTSAPLLERKGDLTAILTALDEKEVLFLEDIHKLRRELREILAPALSDFRIDLTIGQGAGARVHPFRLNTFSCVMTAPAEDSVPEEVRRLAALTLTLENYSVADLTEIATRIAARLGISIEEVGAAALARSCGESPGRLEEITRQLARAQQGAVSGAAVAEFLSVYGLGPTPTAGARSTGDLEALSGVEFEKVISGLLARMGFLCETTKATGDGGIDIVALLRDPVVGGRYLIQCKRFSEGTPVGASLVRDFYGAVSADQAAVKGIFITTSSFTEQARDFADRVRMELIDGPALRKLLSAEAR